MAKSVNRIIPLNMGFTPYINFDNKKCFLRLVRLTAVKQSFKESLAGFADAKPVEVVLRGLFYPQKRF